MTRRKLSEKNIRRITKSGNSYAITIPIEIIRKLKWKEKQKVIVKNKGENVVIKDWKE
ncbi:AbrB/MazE/SpoVT family DNA-binding domain-containing protein [Patescibacteria group bacterium]